jgi:hypothetical protein
VEVPGNRASSRSSRSVINCAMWVSIEGGADLVQPLTERAGQCLVEGDGRFEVDRAVAEPVAGNLLLAGRDLGVQQRDQLLDRHEAREREPGTQLGVLELVEWQNNYTSGMVSRGTAHADEAAERSRRTQPSAAGSAAGSASVRRRRIELSRHSRWTPVQTRSAAIRQMQGNSTR